eukprot:1655302-Pyramimonas_sp.AAC.2
MICYDMLRYVMPCPATRCHAMLSYAALRYALLPNQGRCGIGRRPLDICQQISHCRITTCGFRTRTGITNAKAHNMHESQVKRWMNSASE